MPKISVARPMLGRDQVYERLREAILAGELEPDAKIKETYYTELFGVSRTPLREALRMLEKDGLVVYVPQRGAFVRGRLTEAEIHEVFMIRKTLQMASVDSTIDRTTEEDIAVMHACNEQCKQAIIDQDYMRYAKCSNRFNDRLIQSCRMYILISFLLQLEGHNPMFSFIGEKAQTSTFISQRYRCETALREHIDILDSIKSRDRERLRDMLGRHILNTKEAYLRATVVS